MFYFEMKKGEDNNYGCWRLASGYWQKQALIINTLS
jgi:hypothetical protein